MSQPWTAALRGPGDWVAAGTDPSGFAQVPESAALDNAAERVEVPSVERESQRVEGRLTKGDRPGDEERVAAYALAADGDPTAMRALYEERHAVFCRVAAGLLGSTAHAEDVVQEAWVQVLALVQERSVSPAVADAAMRRTVVRGALDLLRRRRRREGLLRLFGPFALRPATPAITDPLAQHHLARVLGELNEGLRVPFLLRELEGWSSAEIAEAMRLSEGAVDQRVSRARKALREKLSEQGEER